ncbi:serine O-acetyltransferase [Phocaeicola sp.]
MVQIDSLCRLFHYIYSDRLSMQFVDRSLWKEYFRGNTDDVKLMTYIIKLRIFEYIEYKFRNKNRYLWGMIFVFYKHYFNYLRRKRGIFLSTGCFGPGLHIVHFGYLWVDASACIGSNCTILPRVLLGKRKPGLQQPNIFIGDNCYIGTGTTILGPVNIGNNVVIGAGSVVINDIPDNVIVAGVPAKIIGKH